MAKKVELTECQSSMLELLLFVDKVCSENNLTYWIDGGTLLGAKRHKGFIPWDDDIDFCLLYSDYKKLIALLEEACEKHPYYITYYGVNKIDSWVEYFGDCKILAHSILSTRIDIIPIKSIPNTKTAIKEDQSWVNVANFFMKGKFKDKSKIISYHNEKYLNNDIDIDARKSIFFNDFNSYLFKNSSLNKENLYNYSFNDVLVSKNRPYYIYDDIFPTSKIQFNGYELPAPKNCDAYLKILYGPSYMTPPPLDKQTPYAEQYYANYFTKEDTCLHMKIFLEREAKHYKARMQKNKLAWYWEKFVSFNAFTISCIKNRAFKFWLIHLRFIMKKSIFGARF